MSKEQIDNDYRVVPPYNGDGLGCIAKIVIVAFAALFLTVMMLLVLSVRHLISKI